jgi:putative nucleotidyltransferase with HDIG domain
MRFSTRTFLWSFIPFAFLLMGSFWAIQRLAVSAVRDRLGESLRESQSWMARAHEKSQRQNNRLLGVVGQSAALEAGLQLMLSERSSGDSRRTLEDQLREIANQLSFDFLLVSDLSGAPLAGVIRQGATLAAIDVARMQPPRGGILTVEGKMYQVTSVPIDQGEERLGTLAVGERLDLSSFGAPAVLLRDGKLAAAYVPGHRAGEVEHALAACDPRADCELRLGAETYLSLPYRDTGLGAGYQLRSLQSVDAAVLPVQAILMKVFLIAGLGALAAAVVLSALSSRSIVKPIGEVVRHLRQSEKTGELIEFHSVHPPIQEIREFIESFHRAAAAARESRGHLQSAYVEFVESMANALDARDHYTAGHSRRVSEFACAIAREMNVPAADTESIRIGALLHDIGKIGIADSVLQKPGRLTAKEYALIQEHPTIGRKILEGVNGFQPYLPVVELHHENWDGSGYPLGLGGEAVPLAARIVHVADVYDALTSDRPYRSGMSHEQAIELMEPLAGVQFDPVVMAAFLKLDGIATAIRSLRNLHDALQREVAPYREVPEDARSWDVYS